MTRARRRLFVLASACAAAAALFPFTARPISWDEIAYMDLAFSPAPQAWILNRYAHAYAMKAFMTLAGDGYVGAQAYWCALFGVTVGGLVEVALRLPAGQRWRVLGLTLLLLAGQTTLFAYPGVAYADYTIMAVATVSVCVALGRVLEDRWTVGTAFLLGALFVFGMKAKETALPLLLLPVLFFVGASGRQRLRRDAPALAVAWLAGGLAVALALVVLDGVLLGDPLFGLRPSSWRELLGYNLQPESDAPFDGYPTLLLRRAVPSFALYLVAGPMWLARKRDVRLVLLYGFPLVFLLMLVVLRSHVSMGVVERNLIPILPLHCLLAALAFCEVAAAAYGRWRRRLAWAALAVVLVAGFGSAYGVLTALLERRVQREGAGRFAGFYQVARAVEVDRGASILVSPRLYDGEIRPRARISLARLNFDVSLPRKQLVHEAAWTGQPVDYAVLDAREYAAWARSAPALGEHQVVRSDDGAVVLLCLRGPCPRRQ